MTPTDPTTLRTALEALVSTSWMSDEDGSCVLCGYGFDPEDHTLTDCPVNLARAALATPAPTADEARCGHRNISFSEVGCVDCGRLLERDTVMTDAPQVMHTNPAPTPAPPTPPATERCAECAGQGLICLAGCPPPMDDRCPRCHGTGTPPATEPVAALVSELVGDLRLSELGRDGRLDIVARKLDAIVAAARAEVDVEALALALHDAHIECRFWYVDGARTESEFHHDHATRIIAALARRAGGGTVTDLDPRWAFCLTSCGCDGRSLAIECSGDFPASHGGRCKRCTR